ncbi:MAG: hypothetical protein K6F61_06490 [Clostridiales bacterium]|nr:hypothetical protein [Clostridiales bacterium]
MGRKCLSVILAAMMAFTVSAALAKTVEPEGSWNAVMAGLTVHATVGEYNEITGTFEVTMYEPDQFAAEAVESLAAGDVLLADGQAYTVREMTAAPDGEPMALTEDGMEIIFDRNEDGYSARYSDDDRQCMHAFRQLHLAPSPIIIFEDNSDPDLDAEVKVTEGLEEILKIKAEKEENSIGFDFYATTVTLSENLQILKIHQDFDVAQ